MALGLNLAAVALVGGVLAIGEERGWVEWSSLALFGGAGLVAGTLVFRFPWAVGLPTLALTALSAWLIFGAMRDFRPLDDFSSVRVQPLTDRETVTSFVLRADFLEPPEGWRLVPELYRLRTSAAEPAEWWWPWVASRGWARSVGAPLPEDPVKFGVYSLTLRNGDPFWKREAPVLSPSE